LIVNPVAQGKRGGARRPDNGDPSGRPARKDPSALARKRAFLLLEAHRESLAAQVPRQVRARRRYEHLCLVKMVTRLQRDYLSQPTSAGDGTPPEGYGVERVEYSVADWARPWGPSCLQQLQADLNVFDRKLKSSRRWLSATTQRDAEAKAGERFLAIIARMGGTLKVAEFALPRWAGSSTRPSSRGPARRRVAPGRDGPPAATRRRLDLNKATFEELRSLDLSSTQSRRLLAYRKRLHGFESIDQLDQVPGFPKRVRDQLQHQLTV
jgi:DNA uptake protein ComE-like DNA-binding protein